MTDGTFEEKAATIIDYGGYPEIHAGEIGDAYLVRSRLRYVMVDWYRVDGVWQRRVVGIVTRPIAGIIEDQQRILALIARKDDANRPAAWAAIHH